MRVGRRFEGQQLREEVAESVREDGRAERLDRRLVQSSEHFENLQSARRLVAALHLFEEGRLPRRCRTNLESLLVETGEPRAHVLPRCTEDSFLFRIFLIDVKQEI